MAIGLMLIVAEPGRAQPSSADPVALATRLVDETRPEDNDYRHGEGLVTWRGVDGAARTQSHTDCSGLLNAVFARAFGLERDDFARWLGVRRPLASTYHDAIEQQRGFARIAAVQDLRRGDLIAIKYPDGSPNTGHIMIATDVADHHVASSPTAAGTVQWTLPIIDSSRSGHGRTDSRADDAHHFRKGIGRGVLRLYADAQGGIVGYSWSLAANSAYYPLEERHLVAGRLALAGWRGDANTTVQH
jgi:hypothetical protein